MIEHPHQAEFRFYAELNDFLHRLPGTGRVAYRFSGRPSVKDAVEAMGVPHTEVDLLLVNGVSVGFGHQLEDGDRVAVYPVFEGLDISPLSRLRPEPLRRTAFVLDVHLGKLARILRLLGFDTLYENDADELYDLSSDLSESTDLSASHPAEARKLRERLLSYLERVEARLPTPNPEFSP